MKKVAELWFAKLHLIRSKQNIINWLSFVGGLGIFLLAWELSLRFEIANPNILPFPNRVFSTIGDMFVSNELQNHVLASLKRVGIGFFIATAIGVPSGLLLGISRRVYAFTLPVIEILRPIPPIAWIPLAILWFGIGDHPAYFIVAIGSFFPIFINTYTGISSVEVSYKLAAKSLGANSLLIVSDVLIPASAPYIVTGLRIGIGVAWTSVIAAEMVGAQSGLGYMIQLNRIVLRTDKVVAGMLLIGMIGLSMNLILTYLERKLLRWQKGSISDYSQ